MTVYAPEVEKILTSFVGTHNNLFEYDNYTYHIQFYIVDAEAQKEYSDARFSNFNTSKDLDVTSQNAREASSKLNGHKIIIAESGKTNDISIESLNINTVPGFGTDNFSYAASTEFKLKIKEVAGCGLVNKIHLVSSMVGYSSYIYTPYFLSIWFTGYKNTDKEKINKRIPNIFNGCDHVDFQVIIEDVKTNVGEESTTYDMTLRPITDIGLMKEFSYVNDFKLGEIQKGWTFRHICDIIEEKKNAEIEKNLGKSIYSGLYYGGGSDGVAPSINWIPGKAFKIEFISKIPNYDEFNKNLVSEVSELDSIKDRMKSKYKDHVTYNFDDNQPYDLAAGTMSWAHNQAKKDWKKADGFIESTETAIGAGVLYLGAGLLSAAFFVEGLFMSTLESGAEVIHNGIIDSNNNKISENLSKIIKDYEAELGTWPIEGYHEESQNNNITSLLTNIFFICCPDADYMPTYNFVPYRVGEYKGKTYYSVKLCISFVYMPGISEFKNNVSESKILEAALFGPKTIDEAQLRYLKEIIISGALQKKYRWLLNGVENSVLNYDFHEDFFWYLNTGFTADNESQLNTKLVNKNDIVDDSTIAFFKQKKQNAQNLINIVNRKLSPNGSESHDDININDVANMLDSQTAELLKETYMQGAEANDMLVKLQSSVSDNDSKENEKSKEMKDVNRNIMRSKIAAENFLSHGQKVELKLNIIGDPYWLSFSPENVQTLEKSLPHIIMDMKTFTKLDSNDIPQEEYDMRLITLYRITDIKSSFEEGKFLQELHGYVVTLFVHGTNIGVTTIVGRIEDNDRYISCPIVQLPSGELKILNAGVSWDDVALKRNIDVYMNNTYIGNAKNIKWATKLAEAGRYAHGPLDVLEDDETMMSYSTKFSPDYAVRNPVNGNEPMMSVIKNKW